MSASTILPLQLEGVGYAVDGRPLVEGISARFEAGPRTVILGPNGAGKSLLLRLCHGLLKPTAGRVEWMGPAAAQAGRRQAMVFQRPLMLGRSARANVEYPLKLREMPAAERRWRGTDALARTGLSALAGQPARRLSVGEQQRLALARAWVSEPEVLFLDEPTASLDPASTFAVEEIAQAIHRAGTKIIMTTHDLAQARRLADEILFLHRGQLLEHAPAADFFARPATIEAQAFLAGTLRW